MSTPKRLQNKKTKAIFPYHPQLAKNPDMLPYGQIDDVDVEDSANAPAEKSFQLSKANKETLIEYALNNFGVKLEDSQTVKELREQVKQLIDEQASE
ncbi:hypothetical protein A3765_28495 [Oleiphilus sp. HI0130]|nr:hypothetical protein A3765_28790 [Oleiphilus sp. HI0130]KZZ72492.1 hypothetical protein A3765_28495 [Oleiphilus sp. HI0130]